MTCGPNSDAVEEVFAFVETGRVFVFASVPGGVRREPNLEWAKHLAWEEPYGVEGYTWTDMREGEVAAVWRDAYSMEGIDDIREALAAKSNWLLPLLKQQLRGPHADLLDDVFADLSNCAFKRAVQGRRAGFLEDMFEAYNSGGWPCGLDGDYLKGGRLVAYYPDSESSAVP